MTFTNPRTDSENNGHLSCPFLVRLRNFHQRNGEPLSSELIFSYSPCYTAWLAYQMNLWLKIATMKFSLKLFQGRLAIQSLKPNKNAGIRAHIGGFAGYSGKFDK
jgi:hypothetical protein